jgi:hypothetical protein
VTVEPVGGDMAGLIDRGAACRIWPEFPDPTSDEVSTAAADLYST